MNQTNEKEVDKKKHNFKVARCHMVHNHPLSQDFTIYAINRFFFSSSHKESVINIMDDGCSFYGIKSNKIYNCFFHIHPQHYQ